MSDTTTPILQFSIDTLSVIVEDARTDVLGVVPSVDKERLTDALAQFPALVKHADIINIGYALPSGEMVDNQFPGEVHVGTAKDDESKTVACIHVTVSDRLDFTESALRRVNRNLIALMRSATNTLAIGEGIGDDFGKALATALPVHMLLQQEGYMFARSWADGRDVATMPLFVA